MEKITKMMVLIKGGTFMMGSPENEEGRFEDDWPQHEVAVSDFYMGRYPVTNEEYGRFLEVNPKAEEPDYSFDHRYNQPKQPVVGVSWDDAQEYAKWAGLRLPTEAEWEYACRAGTQTRYYTGDSEKDLDRAGWYDGNSGSDLHLVGEKEPNAFGLYDMHGNVWEWVEDQWHDSYDGDPSDGSVWVDKSEGSYRVIRGGSWNSYAWNCRTASRCYYSPGYRFIRLGFRLAFSPA